MSASHVLPLTALIASIVLLMQNSHRALALVALVVSGIEMLLAFGIVHFGVRGLPLGLIFGATLAIVGSLTYARVHRKSTVAAGTLIAFVGAVQALSALHLG
jgi:hypothetical protein